MGLGGRIHKNTLGLEHSKDILTSSANKKTGLNPFHQPLSCKRVRGDETLHQLIY